ncbi:EPOP protein, partial [Climacteris rufus]|nr:EPOP protein [Climacteris rufus]
SSSSSSSSPPSPSSTPGGDPQQKEGAEGKDLHKDASDNGAGLELAEPPGRACPGPAPSPELAPELGSSPGPAKPGGSAEQPRREHFDRLIRQSKLWCYAKGFNLDGKSLRPAGRAEPWRGAGLRAPGPKAARSPGAGKTLRGSGSDGSAKRRRLAGAAEEERRPSSGKGRPPKTPRRKGRKGNAACKGPAPPRNSFSLMGNFPCIPALVVGEDGDLCPASSLGGKNSWALSKTHPLWSWHLGGNAMPVPPSLKFRGL